MNQGDKRRWFQMAEAAGKKSALPKMVTLGKPAKRMTGVREAEALLKAAKQ